MKSIEAFALARKYKKVAGELETYISVIKNEIEWHLEDSSLGNPSISGGKLEGKYVDLFEAVLNNWKNNFRDLLDYTQSALDTINVCETNALEKAEYFNSEGQRLHAAEEAERRRAEEARRRAEETEREVHIR